jgi:hypothetical protein
MSRLQTERGEGYMLPVGIEYSLRISSGRTLDTRQRSRRYLSNKSIIQQLANVCVKDRKKVKGCASKRLLWAGWLAAYGQGVNLFSQAPTPQIEGEKGIIESEKYRQRERLSTESAYCSYYILCW